MCVFGGKCQRASVYDLVCVADTAVLTETQKTDRHLAKDSGLLEADKDQLAASLMLICASMSRLLPCFCWGSAL